jgi:hypothetical protein
MEIKVARQPLQVEGTRYCFNQAKRYPQEIVSVKRYVNINDINLTEDQLPQAVSRAKAECLNYWYHDDVDAAIYIITHEDKHGVFTNHQAV